MILLIVWQEWRRPSVVFDILEIFVKFFVSSSNTFLNSSVHNYSENNIKCSQIGLMWKYKATMNTEA